MKYLTKKWYKTMGLSGNIRFEIDERANTFSQNFFMEIYNNKLKEELKNNNAGKKKGCVSVEEEKEFFNYNFLFSMPQYLASLLSSDVLNSVADIRVLSLGVASTKISEEINKAQDLNQHYFQQMIDDYNNYRKNNTNLPEFYNKTFNLHDCRIINVTVNERQLAINIDTKSRNSCIKQIVFSNYLILERECDFINTYWLYDEMYYENDDYILHIMVCDVNCELYYITISASSIEIVK